MDTVATSPNRFSIKAAALLMLVTLILALPGLSILTVIDRDEARYTQATVQMIETGDYVNIHFQDRTRNKKPAGSYWMQALSVKAFSNVEARAVWAHRLPSVLAALIAVLATYWAGVRLVGERAGFYGAGLLAISGLFIFEAHIAKTDALLCACSAVVLAMLANMRSLECPKRPRMTGLIFWVALGCGVMIKGPLLPLLVILTLVTLLIWERKQPKAWLKPMGFWLGPILFLAIVLPWFILIYKATGDAFFKESIGGDLAPKITGGQEKHGGPPGYYFASIWLTFWPSCLLLIPGAVFAYKAVRKVSAEASVSRIPKAMRLLIAWIVPFWIMLEVVPTKLPHYPLPLFPAIALICGTAAVALLGGALPKSRKVNAVIFGTLSITLLLGLLAAARFYGGDLTPLHIASSTVALIVALICAYRMFVGPKDGVALGLLGLTSILTLVPLFGLVLPSLTALAPAQTLRAEFPDLVGKAIYSPDFSEPSLAYYFGTQTQLGVTDDVSSFDYIIRDLNKTDAADVSVCSAPLGQFSGWNYSNGDPVTLVVSKIKPCP